MTSMTGGLNVLPSALLSGSRGDGQDESLKSILGRIFDERGHFRHITEDSLQAELSAFEAQENTSDTDEEEEEVLDDDDVDDEGQRDHLHVVKAEMVGHVA